MNNYSIRVNLPGGTADPYDDEENDDGYTTGFMFSMSFKTALTAAKNLAVQHPMGEVIVENDSLKTTIPALTDGLTDTEREIVTAVVVQARRKND